MKRCQLPNPRRYWEPIVQLRWHMAAVITTVGAEAGATIMDGGEAGIVDGTTKLIMAVSIWRLLSLAAASRHPWQRLRAIVVVASNQFDAGWSGPPNDQIRNRGRPKSAGGSR